MRKFIYFIAMILVVTGLCGCDKDFEVPEQNTYVRLGNLLVSDRNVGAPQGGVALNYTNYRDHPDCKNIAFKGDYYTWDEALTICPSGWRLPAVDEILTIRNAMQFFDGQAYFVDSAGNRCYFPLSGAESHPSSMDGYYWTSTARSDFPFSLIVYTNYSLVDYHWYGKSNGLSVRCVKTVDWSNDVDPNATLVISSKSLSIFKNGIDCDSKSLSQTIEFTTSGAWTAKSNVDWVTITPNSGSAGSASAVIHIDESVNNEARSAIITISVSGYVKETIPVTRFRLGNVKLGNLLISDRNVGAPQGGVAYNYTNRTDHPDHQNRSFKGGYYTWDEALTICPSGWRLPSKGELDVICNAMQSSNDRVYLDGDADNRCYFPLSGRSLNSNYIQGFYWSSTESESDYDGSNGAWYLSVNTHSDSGMGYYWVNLSGGYSVRCVKTVE